ncbi:MAG: hypothetical protein Q7J35_03310 [Candidatus Methanoperedens sp.]|nr:hypothetical protein [Candidatus Methanoperedens sp.]
MNLDFTLTKYKELCETILDSGYSIYSLKAYFSLQNETEKFVIIRHDIDDEIDLINSLKIAEIESDLGIKATYYFRTTNRVFKKDVIKKIAEMGHEIGYHYETLGKTDGDIDLAFKLFIDELENFRTLCPIKTIAQHGGPLKGDQSAASFSGLFNIIINLMFKTKNLDSWLSKDIWKQYNFADLGILGEAYLSIDYNKIAYFTDTNRIWNDPKYRMKDFAEGKSNINIVINCTDDLIKIIKNKSVNKIVITTHPSNWKSNLAQWVSWLVLQKIRNYGKKILIMSNKSKSVKGS